MRAFVVKVAAVLVIAGCDATSPEDPKVETPIESPAPAVARETQDRLDCDNVPRSRVTGDPVVPAGATEARLCDGLVDNGGFNLEWLFDTLTQEHVDRLDALT